MPQDLLEEVYKYINAIKTGKLHKSTLHTFKLNGRFDDVNIRAKAHMNKILLDTNILI